MINEKIIYKEILSEKETILDFNKKWIIHKDESRIQIIQKEEYKKLMFINKSESIFNLRTLKEVYKKINELIEKEIIYKSIIYDWKSCESDEFSSCEMKINIFCTKEEEALEKLKKKEEKITRRNNMKKKKK